MKKIITKLLAICLLIGAVTAFSGCTKKIDYSYSNAESYSVGSATLTVSKVNNLDINWVNGNVKIIVDANVSKISLQERTTEKKQPQEHKLRYLIDENNNLYIKFAKSDASSRFDYQKELVVTLPLNDSVTKNLTINTDSAFVALGGVVTDTLKIQTTSGTMRLDGVSANNTELYTDSGNYELVKSNLYKLEVTSRSGDVYTEKFYGTNVSFTTISGELLVNFEGATPTQLSLSSTSGDIIVGLNSNVSGFTADIKTKVGYVFNTFEGVISSGSIYTYKQGYFDGGPNIKISTTSGTIKIKPLV